MKTQFMVMEHPVGASTFFDTLEEAEDDARKQARRTLTDKPGNWQAVTFGVYETKLLTHVTARRDIRIVEEPA